MQLLIACAFVIAARESCGDHDVASRLYQGLRVADCGLSFNLLITTSLPLACAFKTRRTCVLLKGAMAAAAVVLTAAQQAHLSAVSSDLLFLLQDAGVSQIIQARFGELGIVTVPLFASLDEDRAQVRAALTNDLPLDATASVDNRLEMAKLLTSWEAAKLQLQAVQRNQAEAKLGVQQRLLRPTEHQAMRVAVEAALGALRDKEVPSKQVIAAKLEMVEQNMPVVA